MIRLRHLLGGTWVDGSGDGTVLRDPATGTPIASSSADGVDVGEPLAWARRVGGAELRSMTFRERGELLASFAEKLREGRAAYYDAALANMGANKRDAVFDIDGAIAVLRYYAGLGQELGDRHTLIEPGFDRMTRSDEFRVAHLLTPRQGIAIGINAFNFPAWGMFEKIATATLAGMPSLAKPATQTALVAFLMVRDLYEANLIPDGVLSFLSAGGRDLVDMVGEEDTLAFTGSADTAMTLRSNRNLIASGARFNAEADSLNAIVALEDLDPASLESLVDAVVTEMTIKAGQKCTAIRRVIVPEELMPSVSEQLVERIKALKIGDARNPEVEMGLLVSRAQQESVIAGAALLAQEGESLLGGASSVEFVDVDPQVAAVVAPSVIRISDPSSARLVHQLEVFGPCVALMGYRSVSEGIDLVRRGRGSLVATVVTDDDTAFAETAVALGSLHGRLSQLNSATAAVNPGHGVVMPQAIHGGPGRAGGGEELGGLRALRFYCQRSAIQATVPVLESLAKEAAELA
ncbi:3,4-dehydroadipyl-CoA semialdehyde dehydrogenase [Ferrimicrobium sp.]|uniref:3,4-dehydroadipyl-CoA semialdehyde dehydrogenase n=1 Tax=Ferrimicrobium sp. TaxID=2926050 RepID=UPI00260F5B9C|nr:3,4-dehydroadipyl-CoA semialdehyde dehydrogenase [Ferrimicrobium sp.]